MKTATTARKRGCKLFLKMKKKNLTHPYSLYGALLTALLTAYFFVDLTACLTADVTAALNRLDPRLHLLAPTTQPAASTTSISFFTGENKKIVAPPPRLSLAAFLLFLLFEFAPRSTGLLFARSLLVACISSISHHSLFLLDSISIGRSSSPIGLLLILF
jgi:hypothetical protein